MMCGHGGPKPGYPADTPVYPAAVRGRLMSHIEMSGDCWVWTGHRTSNGYGRITVLGKVRLSHRVSWAVHHGPVSDGMRVLHRCDNPPCINPAHLFLGTSADNNADMRAKGRDAVLAGERNGRAKLTAQQVREIRAAVLVEDKATVARRFRISRRTVLRIVVGDIWRSA